MLKSQANRCHAQKSKEHAEKDPEPVELRNDQYFFAMMMFITIIAGD